MAESLNKILQGCLKGNKADQYQLYTHFSRKMYGVCLRYATSYDEAQDILQEGFIKVFDKLSTYRETGSLEGWIRRIFVNTAIEKYRERIYHLSVHDMSENGHFSEENKATSKLGVSELLALIQKLPDQYRLVFNLHTMEGLNHKEIGEMLGISESTSRSNLSRARMLLQDMVREETDKTDSTIHNSHGGKKLIR
jgi:RNA polymerase sigma factor (sigma-70 family)